MNNYKYFPITDNFLQQSHKINQDNVPEVGSRSLEGLQNSIENSDYNECVVLENKVVGFVICFEDNQKTSSYMKEIQHKNFKEIKKRVSNFLYIDRIAVDTEFRKNKLATELYSNIINFAKNNSFQGSLSISTTKGDTLNNFFVFCMGGGQGGTNQTFEANFGATLEPTF